VSSVRNSATPTEIVTRLSLSQIDRFINSLALTARLLLVGDGVIAEPAR
jgi:hypothetical protein